MAKPPHVPQPETELEEFFVLSNDPLSFIGFDGVTTARRTTALIAVGLLGTQGLGSVKIVN